RRIRRDLVAIRAIRDRRLLFLEYPDADHPDVRRSAGARRVAVAKVGEIERRGTLETLAPADDLDAAVRIDHVARFLRRRRFAADDVDAVDARHRENAFAGAIANADCVFMARRADDV